MATPDQSCGPDEEAFDRLAASVDRLAARVGDQTDHLRSDLNGLQDAIDELRTQLQWACNNFLPEFRLRSMAADPLDPHWNQKLNRKLLRLACSSCDCPSPSSLEDALKAGWSELMQDDTDEWEYLGLCPDCCKREDHQVEATRRSIEPGPMSPSPQLEHAMDDSEQAVYCCDQPHLAWNGDPDSPGVACESCGYTVAEMGQLVELDVARPKKSSVDPEAEERVTAAGQTNFLWADA